MMISQAALEEKITELLEIYKRRLVGESPELRSLILTAYAKGLRDAVNWVNQLELDSL